MIDLFSKQTRGGRGRVPLPTKKKKKRHQWEPRWGVVCRKWKGLDSPLGEWSPTPGSLRLVGAVRTQKESSKEEMREVD